MTNLVAGDNLLAVEVHNYNAQSPDITFGTSLDYSIPFVMSPELSIVYSNGLPTLTWSRTGFTLQQSDSPGGPWVDVPGPVLTSPFAITNSGAARFYRLRK